MSKTLRTLFAAVVIIVTTACAQTASTPEGEVSTLYVDSARVDCVGVCPMKCLRVKTEASEDWKNFYDQIDGFDYEEGYLYTLKIEKTKKERVPADANAYDYKLLEVVSKDAVQ